MAETFTASELVIPGTFIRVRSEGLIGVAGISAGNVGIVGTASKGAGDTLILSDYEGARADLGTYDDYKNGAGALNLTRGVELLYLNGARAVFARPLDPAHAAQDDYVAAFNELAKDDVNILVAPQLPTATALAVFGAVVETAENNGKDVMAVVGSDAVTVPAITAQVPTNDRIIMTAPGIRTFDSAAGAEATLSGTYTAAAVAGLLSSLTPQSSPTNKTLPGIVKLSQRFSYGEMRQLVSGRVMVLEARQGVRVVRGLTTDNGAFTQVTTRRIVDFAKAGVRKASDPFIGRLNNQRVRAALQGAIDGFLTTMVQDEALIAYELQVTATRQDEIAGRAVVNAVLQPTFSIDFVAVTLVLQ
ncbi:MAG: phage tail sheath subtilisin-like domain-containing protein [Chloroflexi bacterium]|nr:phage tail sheath subtilisin-like domain-containing protein [Chloroflexota bacterium]